MARDSVYQKFVSRWEETTDLPPQTVGVFTPIYKAITKRLKVMPWPVLMIVGIGCVGMLLMVLGNTIVSLVSLLQRGF